jgi:hypothetical protein
MAYSRSSGLLLVDTNVVTTKPGRLAWVSIVADPGADVTVTCYNGTAAGDAVEANELIEFEVDVSLNGNQGGGNIAHPVAFSNGLVVKVVGAGARVYVGYFKG